MSTKPSPPSSRTRHRQPAQRLGALAFLLLLAAPTGCTGSPAEVQPSVRDVGIPAPSLASQPPDELMLRLGAAGLEAAARLAERLPQLGTLVSGYRQSLAAHPPPPAFRLNQSEGAWPFRFGWHRQGSDDSNQLLARFEYADHTAVAFDLLRDSNYSEDLHGHVPAGISWLRVEGGFNLGEFGQLAVRAIAPVTALGTRLELSGSGSLAAPTPLGAVNIQALAMVLGPDDRIETGTFVLQCIGGGAIRQISGELGPQGLKPGLSLLANGQKAGTFESEGGRWVAKGGGQSLPVPTGLTPP